MEITLKETDIQFNNQHTVSTAATTNVQPHADGKNNPASLPLRFPYKIHGEKCVFKRGMEKGVAKRTSKADMAKENVSVKIPKGRFIQKTKRQGICLDSHIFKRKEKGRGGKGKERQIYVGPFHLFILTP